MPNRRRDGQLDGSGKGVLSLVKKNTTLSANQVIVSSAGTVDYTKGDVVLTTIKIISTELPINTTLLFFTNSCILSTILQIILRFYNHQTMVHPKYNVMLLFYYAFCNNLLNDYMI